MTDNDAITYAVQLVCNTARALPLEHARVFLHGILMVCGEHDSITLVRDAYMQIRNGDETLEQIASGQLDLPLDKDEQ